MNSVLIRSGLSVSRIWSSEHPVPNHPAVPGVAFAHNPSAHRTATPCSVEARSKLRTLFRLRHSLAGSPNGQAETGSLSYGLLIHLLLLSTPPRGDAVTFGYRPECVYLKRTRTSLARYAYRRTRCSILQHREQCLLLFASDPRRADQATRPIVSCKPSTGLECPIASGRMPLYRPILWPAPSPLVGLAG